MRWLILGGNGQLGQALQRDLFLRRVEFLSLSHLQLDITDKEAVSTVLREVCPDIVVNTAAWTNVDLAEENEEMAFMVNSTAPELIAKECLKIRAKFVHISTDYVFSGLATKPWQENYPLSPVSVYGRSKAEGERLVLGANSSGSYIIRTSWLYDAIGNNFVKTILRKSLRDSEAIDVVSDQIGQPTYASDLASHLHLMIESQAAPGIYHGTNAGQTTWYQFAKEIFTLVGADSSRVRPVDSNHYRRPATRPTYSVLGHQHWLDAGIEPMRNWRDALVEALPRVINQITLEG